MKQDVNHFDIIVVGGGHAGVEAAAAAARMGAKTALLTQKLSSIGAMSCNPAMGGLGKGHLIREVDAMDGLIGRAADAAAIQFRLLNKSKGPAVHGPRVQADRRLYREAICAQLEATANLVLIEDECVRLKIERNVVRGIDSAKQTYRCGAVILTTGTFLNGQIHQGSKSYSGGRAGDNAVTGLSDQLRGLGLQVSRLKTGTPARLEGRSINFSDLETQWGDDEPQFLSSLTSTVKNKQVPCFITRTNKETHEIVRKSLSRSPVFSGSITGPGPRYCPSIEDKVVRFGDRDSHQVFLEPEGLDSTLIYPNGISTSLPTDVQLNFIKNIPGLHKVKISQFGYAIEYDFVNPQELNTSLMTYKLKGLFLAGQINGTTGYEEAASQGLIAGIGAVRYLDSQIQNVFERTNSYIGVMLDDLTIKGVTEPYRMFTSRAEYRLSLRADNADERLTSAGISLGLVKNERSQQFREMQRLLAYARHLMKEVRLPTATVREAGCAVEGPEQTQSVASWAANASVNLRDLRSICPQLTTIPSSILRRLDADAKYSVFVERQTQDIERQKRDERLVLPGGLDFRALSGISSELKAKLMVLRPTTVGQAGRIEGMTPSALMLLAACARRANRSVLQNSEMP